MATTTKIVCDIKGCDKDAAHKQKMVSVVFSTEQEEGRTVPPYLQGEKLDFCADHYQTFINLQPLRATGAQGYNEYELKPRGDV